MIRRTVIAIAALATFTACHDGGTDAGPGDDAATVSDAADASVDTGPADSGRDDANTVTDVTADDAVDTGVTDAGPTDAGANDDASDAMDDADASDATDADADGGVANDAGTDEDTGTDAGDGTVGACTGGDIPVLSHGGESRFPSLVWTGSEYGVAWQDDQDGNWEVYVARIRANGTVLDATRVTNDAGADEFPALTWDGARYWVAWGRTASGSATVRVAPLSLAGTGLTVGDEIAVSSATPYASQPTIVSVPSSSGGGFAVAWEDGRVATNNHEIYYAQLDATGHRVGAEVRVTNAARVSYYPLLAWNSAARELGLLWCDDRDGSGAYPNEEIYFARLNSAGARPAGTNDVRVTDDPYRSIWPSIVYDGAGYAIAWANESDTPDRPHIFSTVLDANGAHRAGASDVQLSSNPDDIGAWTTAVGWNGSEHLVVWEDQRHPEGDLFFHRLDASGAPIGSEMYLNDDTFFTGHPSLVWSGTTWAMAWEDNRDMHRDIWFRMLGPSECR